MQYHAAHHCSPAITPYHSISIALSVLFILALLTACANPTSAALTDQTVYDYMESVWDGYEANNSVNNAEALVFVDASEHFNISLLEVSRAYFHIQNKTMKLSITDAENDVLAIKRFRQIGFFLAGGQWTYDGKKVNMGTQLPVPEDMKPQAAEVGKEIVVTITVERVDKSGGGVTVTLSTNLPEGMQMMGRLLDSSGSLYADVSQMVSGGNLVYAFGKIPASSFTLEVMSPTYNVQPESIKPLLGEGCKNLKGDLVKFDEIWGNSVEFTAIIK